MRTLLDDPAYRVTSAHAADGYQGYHPYCATWAPFLAGQIVRVAVIDDVPVKTAALGLDRVLLDTMDKLANEDKRRGRMFHV